VQVNVTNDGRLQLTDDTMVFPPLTVAEITALANAIPAAQTVGDTVLLREVLDAAEEAILVTQGGYYGQITVADSLATVVCDLSIFLALQDALLGTRDETITTYTYGPMTVNLMGA
jgi:hypothetical protein